MGWQNVWRDLSTSRKQLSEYPNDLCTTAKAGAQPVEITQTDSQLIWRFSGFDSARWLTSFFNVFIYSKDVEWIGLNVMATKVCSFKVAVEEIYQYIEQNLNGFAQRQAQLELALLKQEYADHQRELFTRWAGEPYWITRRFGEAGLAEDWSLVLEDEE